MYHQNTFYVYVILFFHTVRILSWGTEELTSIHEGVSESVSERVSAWVSDFQKPLISKSAK